MRHKDVSLGEILNENKKVKHFEKSISILIISNINLKSPGESIIKYVLEKELKVNISIMCCKIYEVKSMDLVSEFNETVMLYYENEFEDENMGQKEVSFLKEALLSCSGINDNIFYISDAVGHNGIEKELNEILCNFEVSKVEYYDLYATNRGNYNYEIYDMRKYVSCDCAYSTDGLFLVAEAILRYLRNKYGMYKKCLVLDCDNVLWGGVLDECGVDGVSLGMLYPGSIYYNFQKFIKLLAKRGVVLALCSKNDESDVLNMINSHPFMLIREKDIATYRINWKNKVENILDISKELRIDIGDFIFVDDSPEEIGQVSMQFPNMSTVLFDNDFKYNFMEYFLTGASFDLNNNTEEDANRNEMYYAERLRKKNHEKIVDEKEYLKSLQLVLTSECLSEFNIERMVQLQTRTHRANLSSRIYSAEQLRKMVKDGIKITCYRLRDKYGDYGYIALTIIEEREESLCIKDFYLSCRALGKNIESDIVDHLLSTCKQINVEVNIDYLENEKNRAFFQQITKTLKNKGMEVHSKNL